MSCSCQCKHPVRTNWRTAVTRCNQREKYVPIDMMSKNKKVCTTGQEQQRNKRVHEKRFFEIKIMQYLSKNDSPIWRTMGGDLTVSRGMRRAERWRQVGRRAGGQRMRRVKRRRKAGMPRGERRRRAGDGCSRKSRRNGRAGGQRMRREEPPRRAWTTVWTAAPSLANFGTGEAIAAWLGRPQEGAHYYVVLCVMVV